MSDGWVKSYPSAVWPEDVGPLCRTCASLHLFTDKRGWMRFCCKRMIWSMLNAKKCRKHRPGDQYKEWFKEYGLE